MSTSLIVLDAVAHRSHGWQRNPDYGYAADKAWTPLSLAELSAAVAFYPFAFKQGADGRLQFGALMGLQAHENLFVDERGGWQVAYIPASVQAYPFSFIERESEPTRQVLLCFDKDSGLYRECPDLAKGDERFFDDEGQLHPFMQQLLTFLYRIYQSQVQTQRATDALVEMQLLEPWELSDTLTSGAGRPSLAGLYRVNEAALNAVSATQLLDLRKANALPLIYAQLLSMQRVSVLHRLAELRQARQTAATPVVAPPVSTAAFDEKMPGDVLKFDWLR